VRSPPPPKGTLVMQAEALPRRRTVPSEAPSAHCCSGEEASHHSICSAAPATLCADAEEDAAAAESSARSVRRGGIFVMRGLIR